MCQRVLSTVAATVIAMSAALTVGVGTASAGPPATGGATILAFAQTLRRCDFSSGMHTGPTGVGHPTALVHSAGSDVIADVQIVRGEPDTPYDVRLIQMPRPSSASCNAGDPGVAGAVLQTDDGGAGAVTVAGPISSGATGVWMFISRPGEFSQTPAEFYTSDFVVPL
jgi:hypothetical protein